MKYLSWIFVGIFLLGFFMGQFFEIKKVKHPLKVALNSALNYGSCEHCGDKWNWKEHKTIMYTENNGMFPLCRECFYNLTYPYVLWYFLKHLEDYCDNTDEQIESVATQIGIEKGNTLWALNWVKEKLYKNGKLIKITDIRN